MTILMITNSDFTDSWFDLLYAGLVRYSTNTVHIIPDKNYYHIGGLADKFVWDLPCDEVGLAEKIDNVNSGYYDLCIIGSIYPELKSGKYDDIIGGIKCPVVIYQAHDIPFLYNYKEFFPNLLVEFGKEFDKPMRGLENIIHFNRDELLFCNSSAKYLDIVGIFGGAKTGNIAERHRDFICRKLLEDFPNSLFLTGASLNYTSFAYLYSIGWIGLNVCGIGRQNSRYYEIPSYQSYLLTESPNVIIPNDFVEGEHKTSFTFPEDFETNTEWYQSVVGKIKALLSNKIQLKENIESSFSHCVEYHCMKFNVQRILNIIERYLHGI